MNIDLQKFLWLCPFLSFFSGYMAMNYWFHSTELSVPCLIGKYVHEILPTITNNNLNIRLIEQKEEIHVPEGIILNQIPKAGTIIKSHQPLFIITSKKPTPLISPYCIGKSIDELTSYFKQTPLQYRIYCISHSYPKGMCVAQFPSPEEILEKNNLILYISAGNKRPLLWPHLVGKPLEYVIDFFAHYPVELHIINDTINKDYTNAVVIEQRPFAGTLLNLDIEKPLSVQLRIKHIKEN